MGFKPFKKSSWKKVGNDINKSVEHQLAINLALASKEVKNKISNSWAAKPKVKCPYYGTIGKEGHNMKRYHFDNCKGKINGYIS
jgi:hypothetical protein